ncbi:sigma-E factor regulatory protein RseC [Aeromonas diversa CDC 2478-85]|uniref:Sigma-E factor regulatory protein RseC n=2 Tax=Aeromonas diversa TaxID=502790 RepID=N9U5U5_9GAMM|nr:SoxR reducing system RseC family protein [Aeromonas diversa]ENY73739.1 sigma-E factor regulatory protein RseC [Aeromonas diversa CDC 2478-85]
MNPMSEELATVVELDGDHAWVSCERRSACNSCQQQSDCGTGTVAKAMANRAQRVRVRLCAEVRVGQQIRIGIPQHSLIQGALLVYLLPLLCLVGGGLLGQLWLRPLLQAGEGVSILTTALGGAAGFLLVRYLSRRLGEGEYAPRMLGGVIPTRFHP